MMKILVLGGSSFSGRAFIAHAKAVGDEVVDLSRPNHDINAWMPSAAARHVRAGHNHVVNFIALNLVAESWDAAPEYYRTNVEGLARLVNELSATGRVERFVQVSTPEVYGTTGTFLREGAAFNPSTPYAVSRAAGDWHLAVMHRTKGFPVCFTRTVNVYGPGQQPYRVIPKTAVAALTGGTIPLEGGGVSTRSFIHIRDAAAAYRAVLMGGWPGETYHVATPRQTSITALVGLVCARVGVSPDSVVRDAPERPGKDMAYQLDDSKIRAELGWRDTIALEDGVDEVVAGLRGGQNPIGRRPGTLPQPANSLLVAGK